MTNLKDMIKCIPAYLPGDEKQSKGTTITELYFYVKDLLEFNITEIGDEKEVVPNDYISGAWNLREGITHREGDIALTAKNCGTVYILSPGQEGNYPVGACACAYVCT